MRNKTLNDQFMKMYSLRVRYDNKYSLGFLIWFVYMHLCFDAVVWFQCRNGDYLRNIQSNKEIKKNPIWKSHLEKLSI